MVKKKLKETENPREIKARFIGKDQSMGFFHGREYRIKTQCILVKGETMILVKELEKGLQCPYSRLETLMENWELIKVYTDEKEQVLDLLYVGTDAFDRPTYRSKTRIWFKNVELQKHTREGLCTVGLGGMEGEPCTPIEVSVFRGYKVRFINTEGVEYD